MGLPVRQQWSLRRIEYSLRSDSRLVATMRIFNRSDVKSRILRRERLTSGPVACWQSLMGALVSIVLLSAYVGSLLWRGLTRAYDWLRHQCESGIRSGEPQGAASEHSRT